MDVQKILVPLPLLANVTQENPIKFARNILVLFSFWDKNWCCRWVAGSMFNFKAININEIQKN
jgi:hypothetical protein